MRRASVGSRIARARRRRDRIALAVARFAMSQTGGRGAAAVAARRQRRGHRIDVHPSALITPTGRRQVAALQQARQVATVHPQPLGGHAHRHHVAHQANLTPTPTAGYPTPGPARRTHQIRWRSTARSAATGSKGPAPAPPRAPSGADARSRVGVSRWWWTFQTLPRWRLAAPMTRRAARASCGHRPSGRAGRSPAGGCGRRAGSGSSRSSGALSWRGSDGSTVSPAGVVTRCAATLPHRGQATVTRAAIRGQRAPIRRPPGGVDFPPMDADPLRAAFETRHDRRLELREGWPARATTTRRGRPTQGKRRPRPTRRHRANRRSPKASAPAFRGRPNRRPTIGCDSRRATGGAAIGRFHEEGHAMTERPRRLHHRHGGSGRHHADALLSPLPPGVPAELARSKALRQHGNVAKSWRAAAGGRR